MGRFVLPEENVRHSIIPSVRMELFIPRAWNGLAAPCVNQNPFCPAGREKNSVLPGSNNKEPFLTQQFGWGKNPFHARGIKNI